MAQNDLFFLQQNLEFDQFNPAVPIGHTESYGYISTFDHKKKSRLFWCHVSGERTPQLWWFYRVYNQVPNHWYCDVLRLWEWCDAPHNSCSVRYPLVFLDSREAPLYVQVRAFAWHMQMIHTYGNHKIDRHIGNLEIWSTYYWLVVWNMFYDFQYIGNHHPNWLSYFSEG